MRLHTAIEGLDLQIEHYERERDTTNNKANRWKARMLRMHYQMRGHGPTYHGVINVD